MAIPFRPLLPRPSAHLVTSDPSRPFDKWKPERSPKSHALSRHPINWQRQRYTGINVVSFTPDLDFMISTAYYPYPVNNDKSSARRRAPLQPHIYSPSESHNSPGNTMYPVHTSSSPTPSYVYSGYEQYYSKNSWMTAAPSSWPTYYHLPRSLPDTAVTILPPQSVLVSDIDTPSSISSHSVLTPSSPFTQMDVGGERLQGMEFDEFDYDDEEDFIDSDFADEMEGIDDTFQGPPPLYGTSAPKVIKSTSALDGALGGAPSSYGNNLAVFAPADRRLSASVPGYPSNSNRSAASNHQRCAEKACSPLPASTSSAQPAASYPSRNTYTQRDYASSASPFAQAPPSLYNHSSSSSLAGAVAPSSHASRPTSHPLPIHQPQPIRPIPPIPLADLTANANERCSPQSPHSHASSPQSRTLSPLPLLCQPVSDAVRYQLKEPLVPGGVDDDASCYQEENSFESMCEDPIPAPHRSMFCPEYLSSNNGSGAAKEKLYSDGCIHLPIRWQ